MTSAIPLKKNYPNTPALAVIGTGLVVKAGTSVLVDDEWYTFESDTTVRLPNLAAGEDYVVLFDGDDTPYAVIYGEDSGDDTLIGGFHFAPGENATAGNTGGSSTPAINPASCWDHMFRPVCDDPRGMFVVRDRHGNILGWLDIYWLNTDPDTYGTSRYGVDIADGYQNKPKGHDALNWHTATKIMARFGKTLPSIEEFWHGAYGVKEGTSVGSKPAKTGLDADRTSMGGMMQATGNLYCWVHDGHPDEAKAAYIGGNWGSGSRAGSRASCWVNYPWDSHGIFGARGRSDHLHLASGGAEATAEDGPEQPAFIGVDYGHEEASTYEEAFLRTVMEADFEELSRLYFQRSGKKRGTMLSLAEILTNARPRSGQELDIVNAVSKYRYGITFNS